MVKMIYIAALNWNSVTHHWYYKQQGLKHVVSTPQSPPREGSQGELTPANSQTRMSTNMWGGRLHADSADNSHRLEGHPIVHQHPLPTPPLHLLFLCWRQKGHTIKTLTFWNDLWWYGGGGDPFVSLTWIWIRRKRVLMKAQHLSCMLVVGDALCSAHTR